MAIPSWSLVRVYGTWTDYTGARLAGTYAVSISSRLTTTATDDLIIPAGPYADGALSTTVGQPSLSIMVPATDDPDIQQTGWYVTVTVRFAGGQASETFVVPVPIANRPTADGGNNLGVNLRTIPLSQQITPQVALYGVGVAGGLALLSPDGVAVLDANGDPITGGGASSWADLTGKPAVIAAGATAADARGAIGAGTSNLAIGSTGSTAKAGNWTPGIADLPAGSVLATTGTTRPTARTDITVFFLGADPGANALDGIDRWFGVA